MTDFYIQSAVTSEVVFFPKDLGLKFGKHQIFFKDKLLENVERSGSANNGVPMLFVI